MQTKLGSLVETIVNVVIGIIVSIVVNATLFPALGFFVSTTQNLIITFVFTVVSVIRSYILRRFFNWISVRFGF